MSAWDMKNIRKIAGLPEPVITPLVEAVDEEPYGEDDDPDVKIANADKGQKKFERKLKKSKKVDPDEHTFVHGKGFVKKSEEEAAKKEVAAKKAAPAEKKEVVAKKDDDKKDAPAEAKKRGKSEDPNGKSGKAREWLGSNADHNRKSFMAHATTNLGMSAHHANTFYYAHKKKTAGSATPAEVKEVWVIQHPHMESFMLAENRELNSMQWVDPYHALEPMIFDNEESASKIAKYMQEWRGQAARVTKISFTD